MFRESQFRDSNKLKLAAEIVGTSEGVHLGNSKQNMPKKKQAAPPKGIVKHDVESWLIPGNLGQESTRSPLDSDCWTFDWAPEMSEQSWQKSDVYQITMCLL